MWPQKHGGDVIPQLRYFLAITNRLNSEEKDFLLLFLNFYLFSNYFFYNIPKPILKKTQIIIKKSPLNLKGLLQSTSLQYI